MPVEIKSMGILDCTENTILEGITEELIQNATALKKISMRKSMTQRTD